MAPTGRKHNCYRVAW